MIKPVAILLHEKLIPGTQVITRLEELDYRVVIGHEPNALLELVRESMPMIIITDLSSRRAEILDAISSVKGDPAVSHVPVLAYEVREDEHQFAEAREAGVDVLATEATIVPHLAQFIEQALQIE